MLQMLKNERINTCWLEVQVSDFESKDCKFNLRPTIKITNNLSNEILKPASM